jgi:hypothetical protein
MLKTTQQREMLFDALDRMGTHRESGSYLRDYDAEQALRLKLQIMEQQGDPPEQIKALLLQNIHLNDARQHLIQIYIARKEYAAASKLCFEGMEAFANLPGLVSQYRHHLLKIAEKEGNANSIIQFGEVLLLEGREFDEYYGILKRTIPSDQWRKFVDGLITRITANNKIGWARAHLLGEIYYHEGMWERLLELAQQDRSSTLSKYREQLEKRFPAEICAIYEEIVYKGLEYTSSRNRYRELGSLLTRMKKLGRYEQAESIKQTLKARHPNRRAMIEELDQT